MKKRKRTMKEPLDGAANAALDHALNEIFRRDLESAPDVSKEDTMAPALRLLEERSRAVVPSPVSWWERMAGWFSERASGSPFFRPAPILVGFGGMVAVAVIVFSNGNGAHDGAMNHTPPAVQSNVMAEGYTGGVRGTVPTPGAQVW
jgi:hypothetical protein